MRLIADSISNPVRPLLLALTLFASLPVATSAEAQIFEPETFTLDNGLQVVVVENDQVPVVSHMIWYKVGAADEPKGKSGIAHFLEHLMFKGTESMAPGEQSRIINRLGGQENAFTSNDYTGYYQNVPKQHLGRMMEIEADRMVNLTLSPDHVKSELEVVLEERRSRIDNQPSSQLSEMTSAATYLAYPYRIPVIGWEAEIRGLTQQDAIDYYGTWYAPNNAILVVAGDATADEVRTLAEATYGKIPARDIPDRIALRGVEPTHLAATRVTMESARVDQPSWSRRYLAPGFGWGDRQHTAPLEVLAEILGGGSTSRMYRSLVVDKAVSVSAGSWYSPEGLGPQTFGVYATPAQGIEIADLEAAIDAELALLLRDGVTEEEVATAVKRMRRGSIFARDDVLYPARLFGRTLASGGTIADVEDWPNRIAAVTPDAVLEAARAVFVPENSTTSILLSKPAS
jgi:zinc protease